MTNQPPRGLILQSGLSDIVTSSAVTPERLQALESLSSGDVPKSSVREHLGKGGRKFYYVDHVWVTRQLREAFGQMWEFHVSGPNIWEDGSATILCELTIHFTRTDGTRGSTSVQEVGAWEDTSGKMPHAMRIASAASRGLVRCAFRKFGIGEQFYDSDNPEITPEDAFRSLMNLAARHNKTRDDVVKVLKDNGVNLENIVDRYIEAYRFVYLMAKGSMDD